MDSLSAGASHGRNAVSQSTGPGPKLLHSPSGFSKVHNSLFCLLSIWTEVVVSATQTCRNRSRLGVPWCAVVDQQREEEGTLRLRPPACKLCSISSLGSSSQCCVLEFKDRVLSVCQTPGGPHQQGPLVICLTHVVAT